MLKDTDPDPDDLEGEDTKPSVPPPRFPSVFADVAKVTVLSSMQWEGGVYVQRRERLVFPDAEPFEVTTVYTIEGYHVGSPVDARTLESRGIRPTLRAPSSKTCSIGYCEREGKWYGWSHRAMRGFGVGELLVESCGDLRPGFLCKDLEDCRLAASAFAESVS